MNHLLFSTLLLVCYLLYKASYQKVIRIAFPIILFLDTINSPIMRSKVHEWIPQTASPYFRRPAWGARVYALIKDCIGQGLPLDEGIVKDIHALLMENIQMGGVYRDVQVYISGARHMPPPPPLMYRQVKDFYANLSWKGKELNPVELAAGTHSEFVKIHPFTDGNGWTSRLLMNYQLMAEGFPPISIAKEDRLEYFKTLDAYAVRGTCSPLRSWQQGLWTGRWRGTLNFPARSRKGINLPQCSKTINRKRNDTTAERRMQGCVRCFFVPI